LSYDMKVMKLVEPMKKTIGFLSFLRAGDK